MPFLPPFFNWGSALRNENPDLARQLSEFYAQIVNVVNTKASKFITDVNPPNSVTASDFNKSLDIGDFWVNTSTDRSWQMTSRTSLTIATWTLIT